MILPVVKNSKWEIQSPDGLSDGKIYKTLTEAKKAKIKFLERFKIQGYYASASGEKISLEELEARVSIVEKK